MLINELSDRELDLVTGGAETECKLVRKEVTKDGKGNVKEVKEIYECKEVKGTPILE
jgi:hypothetical protein